MKKWVSILLVVMMIVASLVGCGTDKSNDQQTDGKGQTANNDQQGTNKDTATNADKKIKVTYPLNAFESLDPYYTSGNAMITIGHSIYEPLWSVNEQGEEVGVIAKEWTINDKSIDVDIYDYIYDSEGNHITADDVVFAYNTWIAAGKSRNSVYFASVTKTGDYSVHMELTIKPYVTLLSGSRCYIVSQAAYEAAGADFINKPIATGHYSVKEFVSGNKVVFEKRANHWQSDKDESLVPYLYKANADVVELDVILETQQIQTALETGALQAGAITATIAESFKANGKIGVVERPGNYAHAIMFNCYDGPFVDNLALRKAVMYAIDLDSIALAVTKGTGHAAYTIGNESLRGYQTKWESEDYYNYNIDKAKELMAEAGYPDGGLTLRWLGKSDEFVTLTAQIIQANLAEIGINVEIESLDNTSYMNKRPANSKGWDLCWGDSVPKGNLALAFLSYCDTTLYDVGNMEGVKDDKLQELLMTALYDQTPDSMDALHQYVKDLAFIYGSYVDYNFYGAAPGLQMVFANDGEPAPNAFIFDDQYNVFAD